MIQPSQHIEDKHNIEIKFSDIYKTPEWLALDEIERAQILLVAEGAKRGTIVEGNYSSIPKFLESFGLSYMLNSEIGVLNPVMSIAKQEVIDEYNREIIMVDSDDFQKEYHRIQGKFLGYPDCCIEEYCNPSHDYDSTFDLELRDITEKTYDYPRYLDFTPPAFTPCSINCSEAQKMLTNFQNILEKADPAAANHVRYFNWDGDDPRKEINWREFYMFQDKDFVRRKVEFFRSTLSRNLQIETKEHFDEILKRLE